MTWRVEVGRRVVLLATIFPWACAKYEPVRGVNNAALARSSGEVQPSLAIGPWQVFVPLCAAHGASVHVAFTASAKLLARSADVDASTVTAQNCIPSLELPRLGLYGPFGRLHRLGDLRWMPPNRKVLESGTEKLRLGRNHAKRI